MPPFPENRTIIVHVEHPDKICQDTIRLIGFCAGGYAAWGNGSIVHLHVPPLNTVADLEIWRHELRHAIEGHWH